MRVAINGFGRIGRVFLRNILSKPGIEVVAIAAETFWCVEAMDPIVIVCAVEAELAHAAFAVYVPGAAVDEGSEEKAVSGVG